MQDVTVGQLAWFFPKQTPWKHKFDETIQQLSWFGLIQYWHKVRPHGRHCTKEEQSRITCDTIMEIL